MEVVGAGTPLNGYMLICFLVASHRKTAHPKYCFLYIYIHCLSIVYYFHIIMIWKNTWMNLFISNYWKYVLEIVKASSLITSISVCWIHFDHELDPDPEYFPLSLPNTLPSCTFKSRFTHCFLLLKCFSILILWNKY